MKRPDWYPNWRGETVVIVASGPSAKLANLENIRERCRVVVINNSWRLAPWADALLAADHPWWVGYNGVPEFHGLKIMTQLYRQTPPEWHVNHLPFRYIDSVVWTPGIVGWGGGSGFQALNWVAHLEPARIALVGYDMSLEDGLHWHGPHEAQLGLLDPNPGKVQRWALATRHAVAAIRAAGIPVFNCSPSSRLKGCLEASLDDAVTNRNVLGLVEVQRLG